MKKVKVMVDQLLVKQLIREGKKSFTIEKLIGVPRSVSEDIARGVSRPFWMKTVKGSRSKPGMCTRCHSNPIHPGFTYLCWTCWKENPGCAIDEDEQKYNTCRIRT